MVDGGATGVPPKLDQPRRHRASSALALGLALGGGLLLFAVDPAQHALYPACWLYATTGLQCPGCGGLRATHQLLHGHFDAAWRLNPLAVLLVPLSAWLATHAGRTLLRGRGAPPPTLRPITVWLGFAALLLFGALRNLL
jgi:hypothetical protein